MRTPQPGVYLKQWLNSKLFSNKALVILDLDDTTITTKEGQWLGRSDSFYYLLGSESANNPGKSRPEIVDELDPLLNLVYKRTPLQLTDSTLPESIRQLKAKGITVIAMTARGLAVAATTMEQLKRLGIQFTDTGASQTLPMSNGKPVYVQHGVVMAGVGNKKGDVLKMLLDKEVINMPDQVMLIDDRKEHLITVGVALEQYNSTLPYTPVLCTYPDNRKPFDPEMFKQQLLMFIYQWRDDIEVSGLVRHDAFSRRFIAGCPGMQLSDPKHCDELLKQFTIKGDRP